MVRTRTRRNERYAKVTVTLARPRALRSFRLNPAGIEERAALFGTVHAHMWLTRRPGGAVSNLYSCRNRWGESRTCFWPVILTGPRCEREARAGQRPSLCVSVLPKILVFVKYAKHAESMLWGLCIMHGAVVGWLVARVRLVRRTSQRIAIRIFCKRRKRGSQKK